jgi:hypothetical protein
LLAELDEDDDPIAFARLTCDRIARGAARQHGQILKEWLAALVSRPHHAKRQIRAAMDRFRSVVGKSSDAKALRHIERFAVIFGAGAFAIECGLLKWQEEDLLEAIEACYRASRAELREERDELEAGMQRLAFGLENNDKSPALVALQVLDSGLTGLSRARLA